MHSEDRTWRQAVYAAIYFPVGFLLLAIGAITLLIPGETAKMIAEISSLSPQSFLTLLFCFAMFSFISLIFLSIALPARRRERLRVRVIAGDTSAMPLAIAQPKRQSASELPSEPVVLRWKRWGRVASITATSEGIVGHHAPRKDVSLAWDDIRLLEQWQATSNRTGYCLYGADGRFIEWRAGTRFTDPAPGLIGQRHDALLALAATRTGLPIRTLVPSFAPPRERSHRTSAISKLANALVVVLLIALLACVYISIFALPMTHSLMLNIYTVLISTIFFITPLTSLKNEGWTARSYPSTSLPPPPSAVQPDEPVTIKIPFTRRDLLRVILLDVLPVSAVIPLVRAVQEMRSLHAASELQHWLQLIVIGYVSILVLTGMSFLLVTMLPRFTGTNVTQVDGLGLRQGHGKRQQYIFWKDIAEFIADGPPGTMQSFAVMSATQGISWPAGANWAQPPEGVSPDAAGVQFAAIVAQRAGVQPTPRWE